MAVWTVLPVLSDGGINGVTFNGLPFRADAHVAVNTAGEATRLQDPSPQSRWGR